MNILVPVDIHNFSHSAVEYALAFANDFDADITVLNVIDSVLNTPDIILYSPYDEMEKNAKKKLVELMSTYSNKSQIDITIDVVFGIPGYAIPAYAQANNNDVIIMSVRDKHDLLDRILGSASNQTLEESPCPVILIHKETRYKKPQKILFGFDANSDLTYSLESYKTFNDILHAKTDFVHINMSETDDITSQQTAIVHELFEVYDSDFIFEIKTISGKDVIKSLNEYCLAEDIDIISMVKQPKGLFTHLLQSDKSIQLAQKFHYPVIVFQKDQNK